MKVISIIQPWATLIALVEKKFETRSWRTNHTGKLAIYSSKKIDRSAFSREPIVQTLINHGIVTLENLPTGKILATCKLEGCFEVIENKGDSALLGNEAYIASGIEYHLGDFNEGRYGWLFSNVNVLNEPIQAKGQLGLWNYQELD